MHYPSLNFAGHELCCIRGERTLFEQLSFTLNGGEVLQIQGPNGSGKTSLLRLLCGLARPESGAICVNDVDIREDLQAFNAQIIYIGHRSSVCEDLSPRENLQFIRTLSANPTNANFDAALERLDLRDYANEPTRLLSAGQIQRTALARLVLAPAPVWILDEPFTALDATGRALLESLLVEHLAINGCCVVSTHQPLVSADLNVVNLALGDAACPV